MAGKSKRNTHCRISPTVCIVGALLTSISMGGMSGSTERAGHARSETDFTGTAVVRTMRVGQHPVALAVDETTRRVFVLNQGPRDRRTGSPLGRASVSVLDAASGRVVRTSELGSATYVPGGPAPASLAVDAPTGHVFALTCHTGGSAPAKPGAIHMLAASTGALLRMIATPTCGGTLIDDARTHRVFVDGASGNALSMLDTQTGAVLRAIAVDTGGGVVLDKAAGRVFALGTDYASARLLDAATGTPRATIHIGINFANNAEQIESLAIDDWAGRVILGTVDNTRTENLYLLDARTGKVLHTALGVGGGTLAVDATTGRAFAVSTSFDAIGGGPVALSVLDTRSGQVVHTATLEQAQGSVETTSTVDERHNRVFVAATGIGIGYEATEVNVIDARSGRVVGQVMAGIGPAALAADTTTGLLFVANGSDGTVSVLDPARL